MVPQICAVVDSLCEQVVQRPDQPQPFRISPRGRPPVSALSMAVSFSAGATVAVQVGVFSPEPMSAAPVKTPVVAPTRFVRLGVVIIGEVPAPSGIAVSLVAFVAVVIAGSRIASVAVIAVSPKASVAVLVRRLVATSYFFLGGVFCTVLVESLSAECASSARPIRLSLFCREAPQEVFCPAGASRISEYGRAIFCGPSCSIIN